MKQVHVMNICVFIKVAIVLSSLILICTCYSLKHQTKIAADDILIFCFYLSKKIGLDFFM